MAVGGAGFGLLARDPVQSIENGVTNVAEGAKELAADPGAAVDGVVSAATGAADMAVTARENAQELRTKVEKGLEIAEKVTGGDAENSGKKSFLGMIWDFATSYTDENGDMKWMKTLMMGGGSLWAASKLFGGDKKDKDAESSGFGMKMVIAGALVAGVCMLYQNYDKVQEVANDPTKLTEQFSDKKGSFAPPPEISARFSSPMGDAFDQSATGLAKMATPKTGVKGTSVDYGYDRYDHDLA